MLNGFQHGGDMFEHIFPNHFFVCIESDVQGRTPQSWQIKPPHSKMTSKMIRIPTRTLVHPKPAAEHDLMILSFVE
jgi:hypothetical protein